MHDDIVYEIAIRINDGASAKAFMFTCKQFEAAFIRAQPDYEARYCDHLATLKKLLPNAPWPRRMGRIDYVYSIGSSSDPNMICLPGYISPRRPYLAKHPKLKDYAIENYKPYMESYLSANPALTYRDVLAHREIKWVYSLLARNKFNRTKFIGSPPGYGVLD